MGIVIALALSINTFLAGGFSDPVMAESIHPENCPVQITEFKTLATCHKEAHCLGVIWQNTSGREIIACEFRVFCFDALKRLSDFKTAQMFKRVVAPEETHQSPAFMDNRIGSFDASYICVVPERIVFQGESIWQRTDDSVYEVIVKTIKSDIEPGCLQQTIAEMTSRQNSIQ